MKARLARWLLMFFDRVDEPMTLDSVSLATLLGFPLDEVTSVLFSLQSEGVLQRSWQGLNLIDRKALYAVAGRIYGVAEAEYNRLIPA